MKCLECGKELPVINIKYCSLPYDEYIPIISIKLQGATYTKEHIQNLPKIIICEECLNIVFERMINAALNPSVNNL